MGKIEENKTQHEGTQQKGSVRLEYDNATDDDHFIEGDNFEEDEDENTSELEQLIR